MTADYAQSVLSVSNSENVNNNTLLNQSSINVSGKYTKYTSYIPWPTPCEVALEMENMASCERLAAASAGMAEFDWAEHSLEQKLRIPQSEPLGKYIYRHWAVEIGAPTSSLTATLLLQSDAPGR